MELDTLIEIVDEYCCRTFRKESGGAQVFPLKLDGLPSTQPSLEGVSRRNVGRFLDIKDVDSISDMEWKRLGTLMLSMLYEESEGKDSVQFTVTTKLLVRYIAQGLSLTSSDKKILKNSAAIQKIIYFLFFAYRASAAVVENVPESDKCLRDLRVIMNYCAAPRLDSHFHEISEMYTERKSKKEYIRDRYPYVVMHKLSKQEDDTLSISVKKFYESVSPTDEDRLKSQKVFSSMRRIFSSDDRLVKIVRDTAADLNIGELSDCVLEAFHCDDLELKLFGSSLTELGLSVNSDMDFNILGLVDVVAHVLGETLTEKWKKIAPRDSIDVSDLSDDEALEGVEPRVSSDEKLYSPESFSVRLISKAIEQHPDIFELQESVYTARIPVVKALHIETDVSIDITSANDLSNVNSLLVKAYADFDDRIRPLIFAVKYWAKNRGICSAFAGTLSSYAWTILVLFFLQQEKIVPNLQAEALERPNEYVDFRGNQYNISFDNDPERRATDFPDRGSQSGRKSVGVLLRDFFAFYSNFSYDLTVISLRAGHAIKREKMKKLYHKSTWRFAIEDPFETDIDIASSITSSKCMKCISFKLQEAMVILSDQLRNLAMMPIIVSKKKSSRKRFDLRIKLEEYDFIAPTSVEEFKRRCFSCGNRKHQSRKCPLLAIFEFTRKGNAKITKHPLFNGTPNDTISEVNDESEIKDRAAEPVRDKSNPTAKKSKEKKSKKKGDRICNASLNGGICKLGDACKFKHVSDPKAPPGF